MATYRHWRIYVTAVDGSTSYASFGEIELKADAGGADLTTGLGASASQSGDSAVGSAAAGIDNNTGSECGSSLPLPWWWAIDLGSAQEVTVCTLSAQRVVPNRSPKDFEIQGSADGSAWTTVVAYTGVSGWAEYEQRAFTFGDQYEVRGELRVSGVLLSSTRRVRVYRRTDGELVGEADSAAGLFAIPTGTSSGEYYIIPIDLDSGATDWAPPCANRVISTLVE